jgi:protein O-mannosyl-transferase
MTALFIQRASTDKTNVAEPTSPEIPPVSPPPAPPAPPETAPAPEPGATPIEAARMALSASALPGRLWGLPKLTARFDALLLPLVLLAALLAYATMFSGELVLDARTMVQGDPRIRDLDHLDDIFGKNYGFPLVTNDGLYRPLTTLSYLFNYAILGNGANPAGYHAVNWALHALNAVLVFYLVTVVFRSTRAGFAAAILFACQPANTEAVAYTLGRADLLSTTLILLALFAHLAEVALGSHAGWKWLLRLTLWLLFFLALLAKESAIVLLPLVALFDWLFDWRRYTGQPRRDFWENCLRKFRGNYLWMLLIWLGYLGMRALVLLRLEPRQVNFLDNPLADSNILDRLLTACNLTLRAAYQLVFPQWLCADYSFSQIVPVSTRFHAVGDWLGVLSLLAILGTLYVTWRFHRPLRALAFWIGWFLLALAANLGVLSPGNVLFSEQWLYLPSISACALVGVVIHLVTRSISAPWWAYKGELPAFADCSETVLFNDHLDLPYQHRLAVRRRLGWLFCIATIAMIASVFTLRASWRNLEWKNDFTVWQAAMTASPDSAKVHKQYAFALLQIAPDGAHIDESIAEAEKALVIYPEYVEARAQLGHYYGVKADLHAAPERAAGRPLSPATRALYTKAADALQRAAELDRKVSDARLQRLRTRAWAADLKLTLGNPVIYLDLGTVNSQLGLFPKSLEAFGYAARISPGEPVAHEGIGEALANLGRMEDSAIELIQSLMLAPGRVQTWRALEFVYRKLAPTDQAVAHDPAGRPHLNTALPLVQGNIERAFRSLVQALQDANQRDLARRLAEIAVDQYGMAQTDFGDLVRREVNRSKILVR